MALGININLGDKLVEKIAGAIENIYDPTGEKKAYKSLVNSVFSDIENDCQLSPKEKLLLAEECRVLIKKGKNRQKIIEGAKPLLNDNARPDLIEDSWIANFCEKSATVSEETFQELWSCILAAEANEPNTVSKRLLHNISLMSTQDANNFLNLAKFCFYNKKENKAHPIIYIKSGSSFYVEHGINTEILKELESFSLIETNYESDFIFARKKILTYLNRTFSIEAEKIPVGNVRLTFDGQRLYSIIHPSQNLEIFDYTWEKLQYRNCSPKVLTDYVFKVKATQK